MDSKLVKDMRYKVELMTKRKTTFELQAWGIFYSRSEYKKIFFKSYLKQILSGKT